MTVRHLLGGAVLAAAATMFAATSASAQYSFSTTSPTAGPIFGGSANLSATSVSSNSPVTLGNVALTPFFNYNETAKADQPFSNVAQTLTVTATKNGVAAQNSQSTTITISGNTSASGNGAVTITNFSFAPLTQFVFNFADGSTLTLGGFGASNATGGSDGIFGYTSAVQGSTLAPEPGSLALAATGLLGTIGMVTVRRRRSN